jgi:succinyl-diaminopimelate desuccinylase
MQRAGRCRVLKMESVLDKLKQLVDDDKKNLIDDIRGLVGIPSVEGPPETGKPFGKAVDDSLEAVLAIAKKMGFETASHEGYVGTIDWGEGETELGILSHVDVVPPGNADEWETPPYELTEKNDLLCGRGIADDKGPLLSALYGVWELKKLGFVPAKRVRFIIGTNEETGCKCVEYYKRHFRAPDASFSPDGMFTVVNREKGILSGEYVYNIEDDGTVIRGGEAVNLVPAKAEALLRCGLKTVKDAIDAYGAPEGMKIDAVSSDEGTRLLVTGKSAHAMNPTQGISAIIGALNVIARCDGVGASLKSAAESVLSLLDDRHDGSAFGIACSDEVSGASTVNLGIILLEKGVIRLKFDVRTPVTVSLDEIALKVKTRLGERGFEAEAVHLKHPLYVSADTELIKTLCRVYEAVTGEASVLYSIGGGTYARSFDNCVCFGSVYPKEELTVHSPNERTKEENIIRNAVMYGLAVYELTK